jgi:hypothetical protein
MIRSQRGIVNTDSRPICYQYTALIWLAKFIPSIAFWDPGTLLSYDALNRYIYWLYGALGLALFLLGRASRELRRNALMALAGCMGMALETVLILHFQVKNGVLFQDLGLLLMSFMGGLAAGAVLCQRLTSSGRSPGRPLWQIRFILIGIAALLCAITAEEIRSGRSGGLLEVGGLLFVTGFFVSGVFVYAGSFAVDEQRRIVNRLYAADLLGSSLGCIASSLFLVPLFGLYESTLCSIALVPLMVLLL